MGIRPCRFKGSGQFFIRQYDQELGSTEQVNDWQYRWALKIKFAAPAGSATQNVVVVCRFKSYRKSLLFSTDKRQIAQR
jgi:hypothetical protein